MNNSIINGKPWYDNNGNRIQAHGGSILFHNNTYYWYGENKEKTAPNNGIWQWGVRLYSSKDLYNWCDEGLILYPNTEDVNSPTHPSACLERPHIIFNDFTKQFVMWAKVMGKDGIQYMVVSKSDTIKGPFEPLKIINPCGLSSGDFDLVKEENGHAYIIFEQVHTSMIIADLTDDYTDVTGEFSRHLELTHPPFVREAPAYFTRNNKHYIFTSGTTAYLPNMSLTYSFDEFHSDFKELGNSHVNDATDTSFYSQITSVFRVPNTELYIALADRWVSDIKLLDGVNSTELFINMHDESVADNIREKSTKDFMNIHNKINTSLSEYVWLPVQWKDDTPYIEWLEDWKIEDYL